MSAKSAGTKSMRDVVGSLVAVTAGGPLLRGSQCADCGTINFPAAPFCSNPDCPPDRSLVRQWLGGAAGTLWSWTVLQVRAPAPFRLDAGGPYAVGMVWVPEGILVAGLLTRTTDLRHDMPVRLTSGELYQDDGRSFAYKKDAFLRERFACQVSGDSMRLTIGKREGTYPVWWKQIRVEIYGWTPAANEVRVNGAAVPTQIDRTAHNVGFNIPDDGTQSIVEVR